jgi:hypothetical protein
MLCRALLRGAVLLSAMNRCVVTQCAVLLYGMLCCAVHTRESHDRAAAGRVCMMGCWRTDVVYAYTGDSQVVCCCCRGVGLS